ncbi:MAG: M28 family peptidase [Actinomycetota bacterium]|nr:M28 family peptidase [Actinomycetota bacterium]
MRYAVAAAFAALALVPSAGTAVPSAGVRAQQLVNAICALGFRPAGSRGERRAGRLVSARFRSLGYRVSVQQFPIPHRLVSQNVVARTPGRIRAIVVAHLDGGPDTVAADDNASGVGAMLEVARQLRGTPGLLFAAVGAEERFQTGSPVHLGSLKLANGLSSAQRRGVQAAISLDMVGHGPELNVRGYEGSPNRSSRLMLAASRRLGLRATYMLGAGSDHVELTQAGIPATWLEWRPDACYDRPCDTPYRISARKLGTAVAVTVAALRAAVGTSQTATPPAASGTAYQDASWLPDGKQIVFVGNTDEPGQQPFGRLLLMDADGRNVREVVQRPGGVHFPAWSPRRDWIAFTDDNSPGAPNIFLIRPDGTQLHQLPCCGGCCPEWSPDGRKIVFAASTSSRPRAST